jgi:histidinol-phosphate phosphatase family protein
MKLVILDRDGTINEDSDDYVKSPSEWQPLPGALEAIARLNHAGWHVVVATNQSGLGRGLFDVASLNAMHAKMHSMLAAVGGRVDAVFYCPHGPEEACRCRKPEPGLFEQIVERRVPAVFIESSVPRKAVEALVEGCSARGHAVTIGGELLSDAMGAAGTEQGTHVGMVVHDAEVIARALGGNVPARPAALAAWLDAAAGRAP